jgi:DNA-binding response OmpR family regulator
MPCMTGRTVRARILVVEDEARLRGLLRLYLERAGYEVIEAADGRSALDLFDDIDPDLLVVDLMLPLLQGEALIRAIREASEVPILIASAKRSDVERIAGLRLGADDYLPKPYNIHELVERVNAILRRAGRIRMEAIPPALLSFEGGRFVLDPVTRSFTRDGREGRLTPAEARLLVTLSRAAGRPLDREELLRAAGGLHAETTRSVDVHVGNLRRKLGDDAAKPWAIETIAEVGYRWLPAADPAPDPQADDAAVRDAAGHGRATAPGRATGRGRDTHAAVAGRSATS